MYFKFIVLSILFFSFFGCQSEETQKEKTVPLETKNFDYSTFPLQAGDILFQDGECGDFCEAIEKVTFGVNGAKFSHVGMVSLDNNKNLIVIEAVSAGVVETPLDTFFNRSFDEQGKSKVVVGRLKKEQQKLIPAAIDFAKTKLGRPYDDVFNILNDKYYCSELLYEAFNFANDNQPIFQLQKMTYQDPETKTTFPIWETYFEKLGAPIPEGQPGLNPGGMSRSRFIDIVHLYGMPKGYVGK